MPAIDPSTPRIPAKFADLAVQVPMAYAEGHALTANEAKFMSRAVNTAVGNSFGGGIRRGLEELNKARAAAVAAKTYNGPTVVNDKGKTVAAPATLADLPEYSDPQAKFDALYTAYNPGAVNRDGSGTGTSADPVAKALHALCVEAVKAEVAKKKLSLRALMTTKAKDADGNDTAETVFAKFVRQYEASPNGEALRPAAEAQVAAVAAAGVVDFDLGDLGTEGAAADAAQPTA